MKMRRENKRRGMSAYSTSKAAKKTCTMHTPYHTMYVTLYAIYFRHTVYYTVFFCSALSLRNFIFWFLYYYFGLLSFNVTHSFRIQVMKCERVCGARSCRKFISSTDLSCNTQCEGQSVLDYQTAAFEAWFANSFGTYCIWNRTTDNSPHELKRANKYASAMII